MAALNPSDHVFLDRVAAWIAGRGLVTPALVTLNTVSSVPGLLSGAFAALGAFQEFLAPGLGPLAEGEHEQLSLLLAKRRNIRILMRKIEDCDRSQRASR